jgi:hypothetical protein
MDEEIGTYTVEMVVHEKIVKLMFFFGNYRSFHLFKVFLNPKCSQK